MPDEIGGAGVVRCSLRLHNCSVVVCVAVETAMQAGIVSPDVSAKQTGAGLSGQ